jgi:lipid-A-disaccharide synthase
MIKEGFSTEIDIEILSVNGFIDPLLRLPSLIRLLFHLRDRIVACGADCFVGIDSNFFNLLLAGMLHKRGVKTVHYVSPTVWAWRQRRIKKIARSVDLMMTLYPFETAVYEANDIPVVFVGHPKADEISPDEGRLNQIPVREQLGIAQDEVVVAILPGSRSREVELSGRDFLATALLLGKSVTRFVIPAANRKRYEQLQKMLAEFPELDGKVTLLEGQSRKAMTASNVVLVNSGTATLEAMLLRKPMVMSYRVGKITYGIVSRLVTTNWFALPNILAGRGIVPEFIQDAAVPSVMAGAVRRLLDEKEASDVIATFDEIHLLLKKSVDPGAEAAKAVLGLCES